MVKIHKVEKLVAAVPKHTVELIGSIAWRVGTVAEGVPAVNRHERTARQILRRQTRKPKAGAPLLSLFGLRSVPASRNVRFGTNLPIVSFEPKGRFTLGNVSKLLADLLKTPRSTGPVASAGVGRNIILAYNALLDISGTSVSGAGIRVWEQRPWNTQKIAA